MESCMCPRVSQSHSIFTTTTFFSFSFSPPRLLSAHGRIFLPPLLSLSRSPSLFNENHAHSAIRVSLSLSRLSVSLFLRPTRLDTVGYTLMDSRAHSPAPPHPPSSPPFLPPSLSPSLAIVRARMPPISVDRQCIHASSPSLYRGAAANTDTACARARDAAREAGRV